MKKMKPEDFSFCESVHAGSLAPWHIRRLTDQGPKFGGGIDTGSLCEIVKVTWGWDLDVNINQGHLERSTCKTCRDAILEAIPISFFPQRATTRRKR